MKLKGLIVFVVCFGILASNSYAQQGPAGAGAKKPASVLVTLADVVEVQSSPMIDVTGALYFQNKSDIAAESASKVVKVYVNEGDVVKKGAPIIQLDDDEVSFQLAAAIASAENAKHDRDFAKATLARNELLYQNKSISDQMYDNYKTTYNKSESTYQAALNQVNILQREKDKMLIRSPLDGVVTSRDVYEGEWVTAGGMVANVSALEFEVRVNLPERVLPFVDEGDGLHVFTSFGTIRPTVVSVNVKGDISTNTFPTKLSIGANKNYREGMKATVKVPSGKSIKALYVPIDAVVDKSGAKGVYVAKGNIVNFLPVEVVGYRTKGITIQSSELKAGDKVVVSGTNLIGDGSTIRLAGK